MKEILVGTDKIRQALGGISEATLMDYIFREKLPAKRNVENVFEVSRADLEKWKLRGTSPKEQASDNWYRKEDEKKPQQKAEEPAKTPKKKTSLRKSKYNKQA